MIYDKNLLAQRGILKRSEPTLTERKRFGEITRGNHILFTVDGEETFKLIYDAIFQAKSSIYIAGYDFDPSLNFVREGGQDSSNMSDGTSGASIAINRNSRRFSSKSSRFTKGSVVFYSESQQEDHHSNHQFLVLPKVIKILYLVYLISQLQGNVSKLDIHINYSKS
jgi:hypothetical protein